ncbi:two-component system OmpR family response regulator [Methylovirgula ligni]|uniref:Two-component system OmpR family response regulator n=2 Tax=Methylovirgula ligni TaxID=569860 RepID=A0A3D9YXY3_9HYPH|nr:two-component system OmpR family response regulator [Methylovirgula ligni]
MAAGAFEPSDRPAVLLVEDEFETAQEISLALEREGYAVRIADSLQQVSDAIRIHMPAVMIIDRMLHGTDSIAMIEAWREEGNRVPVLVVSALSSIDDRIRGLRAGGDDYLVKPFAIDELVARVEVLRRRANDSRVSLLRVGPLAMDLIERSVHRGDRKLELLPREFNLLEYFMRHPNQTITRAMLLTDVWHFRTLPQTNVVDVHIGKLRRKVDGPGEIPMIETVRATGFILHGDR